MIVYDNEKDLGLDTMLMNDTCTSSVDVIIENESKFVKADTLPEHVLAPSAADLTPDITSVHGILVTTNWNKNDDVFSPEQVWAARNTPIFKPANMNHDGNEMSKSNEILGVIYSSIPVDDSYEPLKFEGIVPTDKFHILVGMYLWSKYFPTYSQEITEGVNTNKMFISMECMFNEYGYALQEKGSTTISLISRNNDTAWLSASLRRYKGSGTVVINNKIYRIGRWLKNITFTGVGFVPKPANPESILFQDIISSTTANYTIAASDDLLKVLISKKFDILETNRVLDLHKGTISLWPNN